MTVNKDLVEPTPVTLANVKGGKKNREDKHVDLRVLLDSGSSHSIIQKKFCSSGLIKNKRKYSTGGGLLDTKYYSEIIFTLPEFSDKKIITGQFSVVDTTNISYDMIIGRDLMPKLQIDISFKERNVSWEGIKIPLRDYNKIAKWNISQFELNTIINEMREPIVTEQATNRMIKILDSKYEKANLKLVVSKAVHLKEHERTLLYELLIKYQEIFDGSLGEWQTTPVNFELHKGSKPHSQNPYSVPRIYKETFKKELDRLVKLGVLERVELSEWGSPTFIIPKKDNRIRFVSDFRRLNKKIKRKPYPLPKISDTLQQLEGFQYATSLDMNMGYYHLKLTPEASEMCTIVTEFGKYRYKRLPMGVSCSPDIFQSKIYDLLGDIEGTKAYIDDILVVNKGSFKDHLKQLEEIFRRCQKTNIK